MHYVKRVIRKGTNLFIHPIFLKLTGPQSKSCGRDFGCSSAQAVPCVVPDPAFSVVFRELEVVASLGAKLGTSEDDAGLVTSDVAPSAATALEDASEDPWLVVGSVAALEVSGGPSVDPWLEAGSVATLEGVAVELSVDA